MAQSFFHFKQFRVEQGNCGMKVTTDACIQGAWTPVADGPQRILDVGTGTGLLSLMLAQRAPLAHIDALEIDAAAAIQAGQNSEASIFKDQIRVHRQDARSWQADDLYDLYDLVICNPPFFLNSLSSPQHSRNIARHDVYLRQQDIIELFSRVLAPHGHASVLLPVAEWEKFNGLATPSGWHLQAQLKVRDHQQAPVKRVIAIYSRNCGATVSGMLTIRQPDGTYTDEFTQLMTPYYLYL